MIRVTRSSFSPIILFRVETIELKNILESGTTPNKCSIHSVISDCIERDHCLSNLNYGEE